VRHDATRSNGISLTLDNALVKPLVEELDLQFETATGIPSPQAQKPSGVNQSASQESKNEEVAYALVSDLLVCPKRIAVQRLNATHDSGIPEAGTL
jgi:hypothetical protein